jgi:hypothetical protein
VLNVKQLTWALLLVLPAGAFAADVYRSVNDEGLVVYSDRPTGTADETRLNVATATPVAAPAAAQPSATATRPTADAALTAEIPRAPTAEELAANRAVNCEAARQREAAYATAHKLFRELADGEREYLTAEEIDEARATASADVAAWCN